MKSDVRKVKSVRYKFRNIVIACCLLLVSVFIIFSYLALTDFIYFK